LFLWQGDIEVFAYFLRCEIKDFSMPWNSGALPGGGIDIDSMIPAFTLAPAAVKFEVTD